MLNQTKRISLLKVGKADNDWNNLGTTPKDPRKSWVSSADSQHRNGLGYLQMELAVKSPEKSHPESQCTGRSNKAVGQNQVGSSETRSSTLAKGWRGSVESGNPGLPAGYCWCWELVSSSLGHSFIHSHKKHGSRALL